MNKEVAGPIILGIFALIILYVIMNKIGGVFKGAGEGLGLSKSDAEVASSKGVVSAIPIIATEDGRPSYKDSEYLGFANTLYNGFSGVGTDTDVTNGILKKIKNQTDWNMLIKAFGVRNDMNIFDWFHDEFPQSSTGINKFRQSIDDCNKMLSAKGVKKYLL